MENLAAPTACHLGMRRICGFGRRFLFLLECSSGESTGGVLLKVGKSIQPWNLAPPHCSELAQHIYVLTIR